MSKVELAYSAQYRAQLEELSSNRLLERVFELEDSLAVFPDLGSPLVRKSLAQRYGTDVRKLVVGPYVLLYRHDADTVEMLACVPGSVVT